MLLIPMVAKSMSSISTFGIRKRAVAREGVLADEATASFVAAEFADAAQLIPLGDPGSLPDVAELSLPVKGYRMPPGVRTSIYQVVRIPNEMTLATGITFTHRVCDAAERQQRRLLGSPGHFRRDRRALGGGRIDPRQLGFRRRLRHHDRLWADADDSRARSASRRSPSRWTSSAAWSPATWPWSASARNGDDPSTTSTTATSSSWP